MHNRQEKHVTTSKIVKLPQYSVTFLAGSFGLTAEQAKIVLAQAGDDRIKAAEGARLEKRANN
jgi:hypothetical protein